jgi:hypothetical protein
MMLVEEGLTWTRYDEPYIGEEQAESWRRGTGCDGEGQVDV